VFHQPNPEPSEIISRLDETSEGRRVRDVAAALRELGGRAVLVGGAVRDGLLGLPVKDLDVEVFGVDLSTLRRVLTNYGKVSSVGQSFGVLMIHGLDVDFSLPRRDSKVAEGHRGFDIEFDPTLSFEAAARRRDLTVNAMGIDLESIEFLDPFRGREDLASGLLQATDPSTFGEDPLRGLRVAQMAGRFCMRVDPALNELCAGLDLSELPGERVHEEFRKLLLKGREPSRGFAFLKESRLLRFFPELAALVDVPQDAVWHPEGDVWVHTLMCLDAAVALRDGVGADAEALMFGVLCHDFGKPVTTETIDGRIRSLGHDQVGSELTRSFLENMRASTALIERTTALVEQHLGPALLTEQGAKPKAYRRLARKLSSAGVTMQLLERVARADHFGRTTEDAVALQFPAGDQFLEQADALEISTEGPSDVVQGRHLIARGHEPSPRFGEILDRCREVQDETGLRDPGAILAIIDPR
jgi:tRNA nucleotidyltransferase (CCA-adding enzyme)